MRDQELMDFGSVWMASSPLTDNLNSVKMGIGSGVDTIVLKSVTTIAPTRERKGKRTIKKGVIASVDQSLFLPHYEETEDGELRIAETLFSTASNLDIEMLSVQEANRLYNEIKDFSPETKVIVSFAPMTEYDFQVVPDLQADGIEINSRWFGMESKRPYAVLAYQGGLFVTDPHTPSAAMNSKIQNLALYLTERSRKTQVFREGLAALEIKIPVLYKLVREPWEMDFEEQLGFEVDGITYADSVKAATYLSEDGFCMLMWGKGSHSGKILTDDTIHTVQRIRQRFPDLYISASGGIMNSSEAIRCLEYGANSVQLCSVAYFHGFKAVQQIVGDIRTWLHN